MTKAHFFKGNGNPLRAVDRVKRNDPCPCGSGKKVKNCCKIPVQYMHKPTKEEQKLVKAIEKGEANLEL